MFTWIPIHREAIHRILEYLPRQKELLTLLSEMEQQGLKVISLQDEDEQGKTIPLSEIDPVTFLASFNRGQTDKNRRENWNFLKARWNLQAPLPDDFNGIPTFHPMSSWLFPYAAKREKEHVKHLWQITSLAADGDIEQLDGKLFDQCLKLAHVGIGSLTVGLFWINPEKFLPTDKKTTAYGKANGIRTEPEDYKTYRQWMTEMTERFGHDYPQISHAAHLFAMQSQPKLDLTSERMQMLWSRFHKHIKGFKDFQNPGAEFAKGETDYKRAVLKKFQQEIGAEKLKELVAHGQGIQAINGIAKVLTSNLVSFHAWRITLGNDNQVTCNVLREYLKVAATPYKGPETTGDLFEACGKNNLKPNWDALATLLWALRPEDFFPIKISFYRKLSEELGHELPSGRPDAEKLHNLIEFGRAFWKALEPQKPSDWVDVQSFIWCVCPGTYEKPPDDKDDSGDVHETPQYWTLSAGRDGEHWEEFYDKGIITIGWEGTPDLRQFKNKEEIRQKLQELGSGDSSKTNATLACWEFVHNVKKGDIIFAKQGSSKLMGYGEVKGDYIFDPQRPYHKHVRKVKWLAKGEWEVPEDSRMALKTLTNITPYHDFVNLISKVVGLKPISEPPIETVLPKGVSYWWLNANPKIWNFEEMSVGQTQTYTSHNEKGNKRQKYKYFQEVKPGDIVVGYVTSPQKEVIAVCRITKGLHQTDEGEAIEFEKIEQLDKTIPYDALQANPDLTNCEPIVSNQGSLFKLTEQEYEIIRSLIDDMNVPVKVVIDYYDKMKAMKGLFLAEAQFDEALDALKEKKNVILQGPPGVGKTYIAKRLAYALLESNDPRRIEMIQFHQSYSYEDFIQGFRPTPNGHFELRCGIFHQFCRRAQREESVEKPYVFIIDEINRGNLSKIFGELMMLIEPDKRGKEHAISLAYCQDSDEKFYIPENLHLIGMMNTADRSLAMVDYALRRRFRFIPLRPEFASEAFQQFLGETGAGSALVKKIVDRMAALNEAIAADTKNLGPGYQIGHSYFCPRYGTKPDENWYRRVVESEIVPLIQEYWFDNEQKVKEERSALLA